VVGGSGGWGWGGFVWGVKGWDVGCTPTYEVSRMDRVGSSYGVRDRRGDEVWRAQDRWFCWWLLMVLWVQLLYRIQDRQTDSPSGVCRTDGRFTTPERLTPTR